MLSLMLRLDEARRDQIEVFKILNIYENIDSNIFFLEIKESKITVAGRQAEFRAMNYHINFVHKLAFWHFQ